MDDEYRRSAAEAVIETVADAKNVAITDLEPLYDSIEPEALDVLCSHGFDGTLTFRYDDVVVTITGEGQIFVEC